MIDWLNSVPLFWAKVIAVATYVSIVIWAWLRPKSFIFQGAPDNRGWRDLRIWATVIMVIQIALYIYF